MNLKYEDNDSQEDHKKLKSVITPKQSIKKYKNKERLKQHLFYLKGQGISSMMFDILFSVAVLGSAGVVVMCIY